MFNKLVAAAATDAAAEAEGTWFEFCPDGVSRFRIKLARSGTGNPAFVKMQTDMLRPYRLAMRPGSTQLNIPHEKDREIQRVLHAKTIVKDWDALDIGMPFSVEACIETMKESNDFLDWVITTAAASDNFRKVQIEESAGN